MINPNFFIDKTIGITNFYNEKSYVHEGAIEHLKLNVYEPVKKA